MTRPRATDIRYRVDPGDVPPEKAARRLHLTVEQFNEMLPRLRARGFPDADPDTGMYSLDAIDLWRKDRDRGQTLTVTGPQPKPVALTIQPSGMADRFIAAAKERKTERRRRNRGTA